MELKASKRQRLLLAVQLQNLVKTLYKNSKSKLSFGSLYPFEISYSIACFNIFVPIYFFKTFGISSIISVANKPYEYFLNAWFPA